MGSRNTQGGDRSDRGGGGVPVRYRDHRRGVITYLVGVKASRRRDHTGTDREEGKHPRRGGYIYPIQSGDEARGRVKAGLQITRDVDQTIQSLEEGFGILADIGV